MAARPLPEIITAHALKLALLPGWDEHRAADQLVRLAAGNTMALRRARARLESVLLERHSRVVQHAVTSLHHAMERSQSAAIAV